MRNQVTFTFAFAAMVAMTLAMPQFAPFGRPTQNGQFPFQANQFPFQNNQPNQFNANQIQPNQFQSNQFPPNQFQPNQFQPNQFQPNQFQTNQFPFQTNESPFQSNESNDFNGFPAVVSSTPATATPTTQSPAYIQCNRNCLATNEYNPVCGSDTITYNNERRLGCANQCGQALNPNWQVVTVTKNGNCASGQKVA